MCVPPEPPASRRCPACGLDDALRTRAPAGRSDVSGAALRYVECGCGTWYQPAVPTEEALTRWYDYMGLRPATRGALLDRRVARLARSLPQGRLLEIGCGQGQLLLAARAAGREVWAIEVSRSCCVALRPILGARLHEGDARSAPFPRASFDGAVAIEVLEHVLEPAESLRQALAFLRPGGRVVLTTPSAAGLSARLAGDRWRSAADEHLQLFSPRGLRALLERCGFSGVSIATTGIDLAGLRSLVRRTAPPPPAAPVGGRAAEPQPAPVHGPGAAAVVAVDLGIEAANRLLGTLALGDTLRATAVRPSR